MTGLRGRDRIRRIDESRHQTLDRLQEDYLRGALDAEEYARLRGRVLSREDVAYGSEASASAAGAPFAGWGRRAAAFLVDVVVQVASFVPTFIWAFSTEDPVTGEISDGSALVLFLQILFFPILYQWLMLGIWGQTLGKMALGIAVRRGEDGARFGLLRALGRVASVFVLGILTIPLLLSYLWPLWDARNQTLHDKMANTIVVRTR